MLHLSAHASDSSDLATADPGVLDLFRASTQHVADELGGLRGLLDMLQARRVFIVIARNALEASGLGDELAEQLAGLEVVSFDEFSPNPTSDQAGNAIRQAAELRAQVIVGVGGGSCLDIAKLAALGARQAHAADQITRGRHVDHADPLPLIAVPTTSGSGSEATHFAALWADGRKISVAHARLRPCAVVLDARFHRAMPRSLAAVCGLDALGQAMESLWAVGSTTESMRYAHAALRLVADNLHTSVQDATPASRTAMMVGAHLAGRAINISKTTASHALSYELTRRFGLAHGHGVALTLGHVGCANADVSQNSCADVRGTLHVRRMIKLCADGLRCRVDELPLRIEGLIAGLGLPATLRSAGVDEGALPDLAEAVDPVRLRNNPRRFSMLELEAVLRQAYLGAGSDLVVSVDPAYSRSLAPSASPRSLP
jgi:alcohol dehydrogenase